MEVYKKVNQFLQDDTRKMAKKDWMIVAIITVIYSVLSFINLGGFKNPQTFAKFTENEEIIFELDKKEEVSKLRYFVGDSCGNGSVLISSDGKKYTNIEEFSDLSVFAWRDTRVNQKAQYIKIIAKDNKTYFGEIQAYDENGNKLQMSTTQENGKLLIDEPDMVPDTISYMNSSYFDEVYFPRACYEYLHGITVYEWVHPPVGKLIQMIPVALFGMTPFAYRLMGNIAGILMVGVMYIFGKQCLKIEDMHYLLDLL